MKHLFSLLLACLCLLPSQAQESLSDRLDSLISKRLPRGSEVGIAVYDLTEGRMLYTHQADKLSRPASTMKLLTAITALSQPEADAPFRTELWYNGTVESDTLKGDLYVIGGFDPEFDELAMDSLVAQVARLPFSVIDGRLYGDVSLKDSLYWGSGWLWDDTPYAFQPYLSPLMFCKGVVTMEVIPGEKGDTAKVICTPASTYYTLTNGTLSHTPETGKFSATRNWLENGNDLIVKGNVTSKQKAEINIYDSSRFFLHTLAERLSARGITICRQDAALPAYDLREFARDSLSTFIAAYETPMSVVLEQLLKESDNLNAEALLCRLGAQTTGRRHLSAEEGLDAIRALIKQLGYNPDHYKLADGSGLSNYNYVSPELLVAFLRHAYGDTKLFQRLYKHLPIAGVDGTLELRMRKNSPAYQRVHAKTGSFTGINCLVGYIRTHMNHDLAFVVMNQNVLSSWAARTFQDKLCEELVKSPLHRQR